MGKRHGRRWKQNSPQPNPGKRWENEQPKPTPVTNGIPDIPPKTPATTENKGFLGSIFGQRK